MLVYQRVIWVSHPAFHEMTRMTIYFTLCGCSSLAMGNHLIFAWNVYEKKQAIIQQSVSIEGVDR